MTSQEAPEDHSNVAMEKETKMEENLAINDVEMGKNEPQTNLNGDGDVHDDAVQKSCGDIVGQTHKSPGTPTVDEQGHEVIEEECFDPAAAE